jgi:hypothetical protein
MQLLWIWLLKNIVTFLQLILWILILIVVFDDRITDTTPFFGTVFAPILAIKSTASDAQESSAGVWFDVITTLLSTGISAYCVIFKTKTIVLNDIKSKNLKIALIKAGMYFDENGKLCKRVENATKLDINGDGKAGDTDINDIPTEGVIHGTIQATKELVTIMTADLDPDKDGKDSADNAIEKADLEGTVDALNGDDETKTDETATTETDPEKKTNKMKAAIQKMKDGVKAWWKNVMDAIRQSKNPKLGKTSSEISKKDDAAKEIKAEEPKQPKVEIVTVTPELKNSEISAETEKAEAPKEAEKPAAAAAKPAESAQEKKIQNVLDSLK